MDPDYAGIGAILRVCRSRCCANKRNYRQAYSVIIVDKARWYIKRLDFFIWSVALSSLPFVASQNKREGGKAGHYEPCVP